MGSLQVIILALVSLLFCFWPTSAIPIPDSAGIVEMPPGSAYGGIPYGSVTGMVADYYSGGRSLSPGSQQPLSPVYY